MCLLSQILKRFMWRFRPFMAHRAEERHRARTSSFPSRAVACGVVYCYIVVYTDLYFEKHTSVEWWMYLLFFIIPPVISFSRINLGVHYPSDCIAGALLGVFVCIIGKFIWLLDYTGCSCGNSLAICYATGGPIQEISPKTMDKVNYWVLSGVALAQVLFSAAMVIKPLQFWVKFGSVFGFLLPALTFRLVFLCPAGPNGGSLGPPFVTTSTPNWWSYLYAIGVCSFGMALGYKLQKRCNFILFICYWIFFTAAIVVWRLFHLGKEFKF